MSNICKFEIFSYSQKFAIFMRRVWKKKWVDHNKTDYCSLGGISEVTNKLYKIASILHPEKVFHVQIYCVFLLFHGQIAPKWPKSLSPSPWQPDIDTKIWHLFSSFCIKGHIWCKFHQNLRHAVSKLLWCLWRVALNVHFAAMQDDVVYKKNVSCHDCEIALHVKETLLVRPTSVIPAHIDKERLRCFGKLKYMYIRDLYRKIGKIGVKLVQSKRSTVTIKVTWSTTWNTDDPEKNTSA